MSSFFDAGSVAPLQIWEGLIGRTVHSERVTMTLIEIEPGTVVPQHSHDNEQLGLLIEGSLEFTIGDETKMFGPGGMWRILANVPHSVVTGPEGAVLIEVFSPVRDDWGSLEVLEPRPPRWP